MTDSQLAGRSQSSGWKLALPLLWVVSLTLCVLFRVPAVAIAALSLAWAVVLAYYRHRAIAIAALAASVLLVLFWWFVAGGSLSI